MNAHHRSPRPADCILVPILDADPCEDDPLDGDPYYAYRSEEDRIADDWCDENRLDRDRSNRYRPGDYRPGGSPPDRNQSGEDWADGDLCIDPDRGAIRVPGRPWPWFVRL